MVLSPHFNNNSHSYVIIIIIIIIIITIIFPKFKACTAISGINTRFFSRNCGCGCGRISLHAG